jgi:hypothetical protein
MRRAFLLLLVALGAAPASASTLPRPFCDDGAITCTELEVGLNYENT